MPAPFSARATSTGSADFELPVVGGTIIVDLLERIDQLEREVQSLQGFDAED